MYTTGSCANVKLIAVGEAEGELTELRSVFTASLVSLVEVLLDNKVNPYVQFPVLLSAHCS